MAPGLHASEGRSEDGTAYTVFYETDEGARDGAFVAAREHILVEVDA